MVKIENDLIRYKSRSLKKLKLYKSTALIGIKFYHHKNFMII